MPLGFLRVRRDRVACSGGLALVTAFWLSCSAPDGRGLFQPLGSAGAAGAPNSGAAGNGGSSGSGGSGGAAPAGGAAADDDAEDQGGNLPLAGAAGVPGASNTGVVGANASPPDASSLDAGAPLDSGLSEPPPVACEPSDESCDGVDNDCDGIIDSGGACPTGCTGFTLADHAYMFCSEAVDRGIALARCGARGMTLAWVETPGENAAVLASVTPLVPAAAGEQLVQIGASDAGDEDEWFYTGNAAADDGFQFWDGNATEDGGEPVDGAFANWGPGEPNNSAPDEDCGAMSVSGTETRAPGQWDDRACAGELPFVCEQP